VGLALANDFAGEHVAPVNDWCAEYHLGASPFLQSCTILIPYASHFDCFSNGDQRISSLVSWTYRGRHFNRLIKQSRAASTTPSSSSSSFGRIEYDHCNYQQWQCQLGGRNWATERSRQLPRDMPTALLTEIILPQALGATFMSQDPGRRLHTSRLAQS
jgi:hypothetical protein